jgi:ABC-2 type transport system ATP-binding protein
VVRGVEGAELVDVAQRFGSTVALDGMTLKVESGITGVLGPNGAGKTTMLRILSTIQEPTAGSVRVLGLNPADEASRTEIRRQLGYLPQELGVPRGFTAFGFVEYMAVLKEWTEPSARRAEVRRVLGLVDLASVSTKRVHRLSGGMRRRLGLAQALLGQPPLLLLDEPTTGLDPEQRAAFRRLIVGLAAASTVVLSTHQTEDVSAVCDRVVVMDAGRVSFTGSVGDFVGLAHGHVWVDDRPDDSALARWRTGTGRFRHVGEPPPGAELIDPGVEDAYLLHRGIPQGALG